MSLTTVDEDLWQGDNVTVTEVLHQLNELTAKHTHDEHAYTLARTINLVIAPPTGAAGSRVLERLEELSERTPSHTIVLMENDRRQIDATIKFECRRPSESGPTGTCYDQIVLFLDESRLRHSDQVVYPMLIRGLPTVVWLPGPGLTVAEKSLVGLADKVVVDSGQGESIDGLARLVGYAKSADVNDLSWGSHEFWRARVAAAFEPLEARELLPQVSKIEIAYTEGAYVPACLFAGWLAARLEWVLSDADGHRLAGSNSSGGKVEIHLKRERDVLGCGGIEEVSFHAGKQVVSAGRKAATSQFLNIYEEALSPVDGFSIGYDDALASLEPLITA